MSSSTARRWLTAGSVWTSRALVLSVLGVALTCGFLLLSLRYWVLPNIESYREDIAASASRAANLRITIERISGHWRGVRPHFKLEGVTVYDKAGRRALELARVDSTVAWKSLVTLRPHFHTLDIHQPVLDVRRDTNGVLSIAGIELQSDRPNSGLSDWMLAQPDVEIHNASVTWTDELRQASPLQLAGVDLQIVSRGSRHRFGLRAVPPADLAAPIELRGDLRGDSVELLSEWNGRMFLQLDHVDLGAWSAWVSIPAEITRGAGAVRSWLTFGRQGLGEVVADVRLTAVRARLREDLPALELDALAGRLAWKSVPSGFEFSTTKLGLSGGGAVLAPADFRVRVDKNDENVPQGELDANALDLAPLVMLADRFPLDEALRTDLVALSPRGRVHDLVIKWKGAWPHPATYSARGRFEALALNTWDNLPGIAGLSGNIDGTEKGGTLHVNGQKAALDFPKVFASALAFDTLTGQVAWTRTPERLEVTLNNISFANADAAGSVFGAYRTAPDGSGEIDLTGSLTRTDARSVARYVPVTLMRTARPWLERAIIAGHSNDVRFRAKGRLEDFPFVNEKRGLFHVTAKVSGGTLDYAEGWPRIENIEGDLQFRGSRMNFTARQGTVGAVKLSKVQGDIPDMKAKPEVLSVTGEAEGATADFLTFISKSPVNEMTERFTEGMQAQGPGRLSLSLTLPLGQLATSKVAGVYQITGNNLVLDRELPPLEQANGRFEFTESSVRTPGVSGVFLGGPVNIVGATQRDSTLRATLTGRVNADNVRKAGGPSWMQYLRGSTDWRGALTIRRKVPELVIESNLQGIASYLPAPLAKTALEAIPLRIERRYVGSQQDRLLLALGDVVKADLARRNDGRQTVVERGAIRLGGGEPGALDRPGIWVRGSLKRLDVDEWLAFGRDGDSDTALPITGADVKLGQVEFLGRRFSDLAVAMSPQPGALQLAFAGGEIEGTATWRGEGKGRLVARLKKLTLPSAPADAKPVVAPAKAATGKPKELPALDVIVDNFQHGQKQLGRLEVNAVPQDRDWRIERLRLANAESTITAEGVWQGWQTQPRTQLNVRMDVTDIGKTLTRWGYPPGVRRGTAKIDGQLSWAGSPADFDYPTLGGQLVVEAASGQFVRLEPGLAKLLGILSLQALPRRISLDFRDVFSEGFAFDNIIGALKIDRGVASAENFRMQGPSARVVMSGDVDLARETQKLKVRVVPHLSESVAIAGALIGGPVAGVAAFLAQKLLKDPLEELVAFEYNVTGSWSDPRVAKVERPTVPIAESGQ